MNFSEQLSVFKAHFHNELLPSVHNMRQAQHLFEILKELLAMVEIKRQHLAKDRFRDAKASNDTYEVYAALVGMKNALVLHADKFK